MAAAQRVGALKADAPSVTPVAPGLVRVESGGRQELVYVAGPSTNRWAFWNGNVFRAGERIQDESPRRPGTGTTGAQVLTAPMPATVLRVLVSSGQTVRKGETLVVLEAMKMELPVRALDAGTIKAVRCRDGELVGADQPLVDLE